MVEPNDHASPQLLLCEFLNGSVEAGVALDREMRPRLTASLQNRGATASLAEEIAADVMGDCVLPGESSLLRRFPMGRDFESWLLRVAINRLIDCQRRSSVWREKENQFEGLEAMPTIPEQPDAALLKLTKQVLSQAFASCNPELRVMMWLTYACQVKQNQLARMWGWSESKVSRALSGGCSQIREKTTSLTQEIEPGLILQWADLVQVCTEDTRFYLQDETANPVY